MPRIRIPAYAAGPDGRPIAGASITVRNRQTGAAATVYALENPADNTALGAGQLVSDSRGKFPGWTDRMRAEATITYPAATGLGPEVVEWEAAPAGNDDIAADWVDDDAAGAGLIPVRQADGSIAWQSAAVAAAAPVMLTGTYAARPPATAALNGTRYFATDKRMEFQVVAGAWVLVGTLESQVLGGAALPAAPIDEQLAFIEWAPPAGDAGGNYTRAKYRTAVGSTYRWVCVGGFMGLAAAALQTVPSSTPVALGGMTWTATYSGLYKLGFSVIAVTNTTVHTANVDLYVNGAKVDGRSAPGNAGWGPTIALVPRPAIVLAGQVVELRGYGDGSQDFKDRILTVEPVRLVG